MDDVTILLWLERVRWQSWARAIGIFLLVFILISFLLRKFWRFLRVRSEVPGRSWDYAQFKQMKRPIRAAVFLLSAYIGIRLGVEPGAEWLGTIHITLKVLSILCAIWILERAITVASNVNRTRFQFSQTSKDLLLMLSRLLIISIGILMALDNAGISVTPILASLGVGSIAVALALQDTLSNFFSGIYLLVDQPIRVGDFVKIDNDVEGTIDRIGWRSTWVLLGSNNMVVMPNSKLATARLLNFDLPDPETEVSIPFTVSFGSDLGQVEKIVLETARLLVARIPGAVPNSVPNVRFHTLGDFGVIGAAVIRAKRFTDHAAIRHEFIKSIMTNFQKEGIRVPELEKPKTKRSE